MSTVGSAAMPDPTLAPLRRVQRYQSPDALADALATQLLHTLVDLQAKQSLAQVCLCGGPTAMAVYRALARRAPYSPMDPGRLGLWWSDDHYVSTAEPSRHVGQVLAVLAGAFPLASGRTHPMPALTGTVDVRTAALAYAEELGQTRFDVCLLSLDPEGRIAGLTPGSAAAAATTSRVVGVDDREGQERLSITLPMINTSRHVWVMASGLDRARAVQRSLAGDAAMPAARAFGRDSTKWFLDAAAASGLPYYACDL